MDRMIDVRYQPDELWSSYLVRCLQEVGYDIGDDLVLSDDQWTSHHVIGRHSLDRIVGFNPSDPIPANLTYGGIASVVCPPENVTDIVRVPVRGEDVFFGFAYDGTCLVEYGGDVSGTPFEEYDDESSHDALEVTQNILRYLTRRKVNCLPEESK